MVRLSTFLVFLTLFNLCAMPSSQTQENGSFCAQTAIASGKLFLVAFNRVAVKFNDAVFTGDYRTDPLGTLKGGETYTVQYDIASKAWTTTGFNQGTNGILTTSYNNADPADYQISLWGWVFNISCNGEVFDRGYGLVGTISFPDYGPD